MQLIIVGLVGGIGSGKTTVARLFKKLRCGVIEADKMAYQMLDDDRVKKRLSQVFGRTIINKEGKIDRVILARRAFAGKHQLRKLNTIIHPYILKEIKLQITRQKVCHKNNCYRRSLTIRNISI